jgi:hypothetical protein
MDSLVTDQVLCLGVCFQADFAGVIARSWSRHREDGVVESGGEEGKKCGEEVAQDRSTQCETREAWHRIYVTNNKVKIRHKWQLDYSQHVASSQHCR